MKNFYMTPSKCLRLFAFFLISSIFSISHSQNENIILDQSDPFIINPTSLGRIPIGGDTIFVSSFRTNALKFQNIEGDAQNPIVVINTGGQVKINDQNSWGAISFENCKFIKISGAGHPEHKYGFELAATNCGLAFADLSSDCEAEFIKISHDGFFGIMAKKDYHGNPPFPYPVFENLIIHDCFIEGVSEGMYLGETKSPGMEFKHVKIYNNIVRNTQRESIQIANMVEDIEVYNNTMLNAGLEQAYYHENVLQIGANTVVNAYNNIISEAASFGIINMGKGNCSFTNNYIASNLGIFNDNRIMCDTMAPINISQNFFRDMNSNEVIRNMNEINYLTAENNNYDTDIPFYYNQTGVNYYTVNNNTLTSVPEIQFTDPANDDYSLAPGTPSEYLNIGAPGGPVYFEPHSEVITITPNMITDMVTGGSVYSPLLLFDEQYLNVDTNEHATSGSWKPYYNENDAPYYVIIDLNQYYYISEIDLHDMHAVFDFNVEYGDPSGNWNPLFTDPCDQFNSWSINITDITTRFLRLKLQSPFAAVNEIIIKGYPSNLESNQIIVTPAMVTDQIIGGSVYSPLLLFDEQNKNPETEQHPISNSWKPFVNESSAPYHALVDLGQEFQITKISLHDMHDVKDFIVEYGDSNNWTTLFIDSLDKFKQWKNYITNIKTRYIRLTMLQSPFAAVNEIVLEGYPIMTPPEPTLIPEPEPQPEMNEQIVINSSMVTDLVTGGSVNSPNFLFDEQSLDIPTEHAISNSWKPDYIMNNTSYHVQIDLGQEYYISEIVLHDMHAVFNFTVEYGDGTNWTTLFVDPLNTFNKWSSNQTNISTRYLRLSMYQDINAYVNEIIIYGHSTSNKSSNKKININTVENLELFPNPIHQKLNLKFPSSMIGKNKIQIKNILGKTIYNKDIFISSKNQLIEFKNLELQLTSGCYILFCKHQSGITQTLKFIKK